MEISLFHQGERASMGNGLIYGCLLILSHNILTGWQDVYRSSTFMNHDVFLMTSLSMLLAASFFTVVAILKKTKCALGGVHLLYLNFWTAGSWGGIFLAISLLPPAMVIGVATSLAPTFTFCMNRVYRPDSASDRGDMVICLLSLLVTLLLFYDGFRSGSGIAPGIMALGLCISVFAAFSDAALTVTNKSMYDKGVNTFTILSSRFYLLIVISFVLSVTKGTFVLNGEVIEVALIISVLGVIPAVYLLQEGIKYLEPVLLEILLSSTPLFVLLFQWLQHPYPPSLITVFCCLAIVLISTIQIIRNMRAAEYAKISCDS